MSSTPSSKKKKRKMFVFQYLPFQKSREGELNSLVPTLLATNSVDGSTSTTTTPRGPPTPRPMPSADWVTPVPAIEPARDIADSDNVRSSPPWTPTPPRWIPLTALTPPTSSPAQDFCLTREETPVGLQADLSASTQLLSVPPQLSPSRTSPCDSLGEGCKGEEGQFDAAEEGEPCAPQRLHPSEQPLLPSPSLTPSPVLSQVDQLVRRILELKHSVAASPDTVDTNVVADLLEAPLCPEE